MQAVLSFLTRLQSIRFTSRAWVLSGLSVLMGCSPAFNWRDVRPAQTSLRALFPCKPDQNERAVALAGKEVTMTMLGCKAGDASFALAYADTKDTAGLSATLGQWRQTTLNNVRAAPAEEVRYVLQGASEAAPAVKVTAHGSRLDGTAMSLQAVWFAHGTQVFQATVTADALKSVASETFFSGIRTQ
jgi:hypothetical protein